MDRIECGNCSLRRPSASRQQLEVVSDGGQVFGGSVDASSSSRPWTSIYCYTWKRTQQTVVRCTLFRRSDRNAHSDVGSLLPGARTHGLPIRTSWRPPTPAREIAVRKCFVAMFLLRLFFCTMSIFFCSEASTSQS